MNDSSPSRSKGSSITRVMEIIEAVAQAGSAPSPADLAHLLDIPKPSLHRLLQQLQAEGFVQTDLRGAVVPGERLHDLALGVIHASRFKAQRQAILRQLAENLDETCGIAMPDGIDMVYHDRVQSDWPLQLHLPVGSHVPMWCTASGKLYLSTFAESRRSQIIDGLALKRMARNTITDPHVLEAALKQTASQELAVDDEEFVDGMVACAVPIKDRGGRLVACLYTHAPTIRKSLADLLKLEPQLRAAAARLGALAEAP
ncbi:MAG: IclR family transcriptional regulator [Pseudomonas sp.]|nr:IclR family transcriptional regulator [Pseudomonas sp.]